MLDIKMIYKQLPFRDSDQLVFVADNNKIQNLIDWSVLTSPIIGLANILERNV